MNPVHLESERLLYMMLYHTRYQVLKKMSIPPALANRIANPEPGIPPDFFCMLSGSTVGDGLVQRAEVAFYELPNS